MRRNRVAAEITRLSSVSLGNLRYLMLGFINISSLISFAESLKSLFRPSDRTTLYHEDL